MSTNRDFETIVIGLGAVGSAAAYQLAKRGISVLGIDQFSPPHAMGSSQGDSRITRQAIGEGEEYVPLALRSYDIWKELEKEAGTSLLTVTGGLVIASNAESTFFKNTLAAAEKFAIPHRILSAAQIREEFPQFNVSDGEVGYYEPGAGFLRPEECIRTQLMLAEKNGAKLHPNEKVESVSDEGGVVKVTTSAGEYTARNVVLCTGPWIQELIGKEYENLFAVVRQVLYWFLPKSSPERFALTKCPVFLWELGGDKQGLYGFPAIGGIEKGVKIANHQYGTPTTARTMSHEVSETEKKEMYEKFVAPYLPDLSDTCVQAVPCLYTNTTDFNFVIDRLPNHPAIIAASPCSGHGFKHSAAVGEALAELAQSGKTTIDISAFGIARLLER